jgi:hypothetical protein
MNFREKASLTNKSEAQPVTVEATLLWKHPDRLVAADRKGFLYTWVSKAAKQLGNILKEGDLVFVHADEKTKEVFHMAPKNALDAPESTEEDEVTNG